MDHFQNHLLMALVNGMGPLLLLDLIYLPTPVDTIYADMYSIYTTHGYGIHTILI